MTSKPGSKKIIKFALIALAATAVIIAIVSAIIQPPAVECVMLEESTLANTFNEIGEIIPLAEADLYSKTGGKLLEVKAAEGSTVKKGELLFVFDGSDLKNEQEGVLAEMAVIDSQIAGQISSLEMQRSSLASEKSSIQVRAEQALIEEKKLLEDIDTAQLLYENGVIPAQDLSNAQLAYEQSLKNKELLGTQQKQITEQISSVNTQISDLRSGEGADLRQQLLAQRSALERQLSLLQEKQSEIEVVAPFDGLVRDLPFKEGQIIPPGAKLCSVYQPGQFRVDCYILVENTSGVKTGDEVEITVKMQHDDNLLRGNIERLAPDALDRLSKTGLSEKRIKVEITAEESGWEDIGPYWPVEVKFITAQAKNCLIVPKTALLEDGDDEWKVLTVQAGKIVEVAVEKGVQTPSQIEIKGDLKPGDVIIKNVKTSKAVKGQSVKAVL
jgi:HlyD family secretion protein